MLRIRDLTLERLENNELQDTIPALYDLNKVIENDDWHDNQSVLESTILSIYALKKIVQQSNNQIKTYLNQSIHENTQGGLLYVGAILSNLGKKNATIEWYVNGIRRTSSAGYAMHSAVMAQPILNNMYLSGLEKKIITNIILHGETMTNIVSTQNKGFEEKYDAFSTEHADIFIELNLLSMANTLTSNLWKTNPKEFEFKMIFYDKHNK